MFGNFGTQSTTIVKFFHPAKAVNYEKCSVNYRILLIFQFILAFAELHKPIDPPKWMSTICDGARYDARCIFSDF
jgi:hypothetical protein